MKGKLNSIAIKSLTNVKQIRKKVLILFTLFSFLVLGSNAFGLVRPVADYNKIAWTWSEYGAASSAYNCLGYATNSFVWEWPWSGYPTSSTVTTYLNGKGYKVTTSSTPLLYSYGYSTSQITHFALYVSSSKTRAKWGSLEIMSSDSLDPYFNNSDSYGFKKVAYTK